MAIVRDIMNPNAQFDTGRWMSGNEALVYTYYVLKKRSTELYTEPRQVNAYRTGTMAGFMAMRLSGIVPPIYITTAHWYKDTDPDRVRDISEEAGLLLVPGAIPGNKGLPNIDRVARLVGDSTGLRAERHQFNSGIASVRGIALAIGFPPEAYAA